MFCILNTNIDRAAALNEYSKLLFSLLETILAPKITIFEHKQNHSLTWKKSLEKCCV